MPGIVEHGDVTIERIDPRLLTGEPTYLFNIYSWTDTRNTGSTGLYYVPPCPEDKEWVRSPHVIPGTVVDTFPFFGEKEHYRSIPTVGDDIVKAVLEGGNPDDDIRRFGVFASKSSKPSREELKDATDRLNKYLSGVVQQADAYYGDPALRNSITDMHYRAARRLKLKRAWMTDATALSACPFCSTPVNPGVPKCPNCHEVIDPVAYAALKAKMGVA